MWGGTGLENEGIRCFNRQGCRRIEIRIVRWGILCFMCIAYGAVGTVLIGLGVLVLIEARINAGNEGPFTTWTGATAGLVMISGGSFAYIVSLLALIANALADGQNRENP